MPARPHDSHTCNIEDCTNQATHVYEQDIFKPASQIADANAEPWGPPMLHHTDHLLVCDQHLPSEPVTRGPEPVAPCEHCGRWSASWRTLPEPCPDCGKTGCLGCLHAHHEGEPLVIETDWVDPSPALREQARQLAQASGVV